MDEVLEILRKIATRTQRSFDESKDSALKKIENYDRTLRSQKTSEAQKAHASLSRTLEYDRLERLSSQLSLLYVLQIFAFKVKIIQISIGNISEKLQKSELLGKTKEIEDARKDIDQLKILLEAQYELIRQIGEGRKGDLFYIS